MMYYKKKTHVQKQTHVREEDPKRRKPDNHLSGYFVICLGVVGHTRGLRLRSRVLASNASNEVVNYYTVKSEASNTFFLRPV
jgi:hypothetical protein